MINMETSDIKKLLIAKELHGGYEKKWDILRGVNLEMIAGEAVGVIGLNGSGKSTLGRALMNLLPFRSGQIIFDGQDVTSLPTRALSRAGMALMHQGGAVFPGLTVRENLNLAWGRNPDRNNRQRLEAIVPLLQNPSRSLLHLAADKLSGGQRHELALVMTLAQNPKLLILDEPSAGLSPEAEEKAYNTLGLIRKEFGTAILLIEQNVQRAKTFCDRYVEMIPAITE